MHIDFDDLEKECEVTYFVEHHSDNPQGGIDTHSTFDNWREAEAQAAKLAHGRTLDGAQVLVEAKGFYDSDDTLRVATVMFEG